MQVDNFGTVNLVEACRKIGVNRFILISSILVNGAAMGQILNPAYVLLNAFGLTLIAKLQAEQYIRKSGINYTIIRPGGLRDDPPSGNIIMEPEVTMLIIDLVPLFYLQLHMQMTFFLSFNLLLSFFECVLQDTLYEGSVSRDQVAEVAVEAILCPESYFKVVEIVSRSDGPRRPIKDLFSAIQQK